MTRTREGNSPPDEPAAEWVPRSSLKPWDQNPRHNDPAVTEVAASIMRFGFSAPIVARAADRTVIAGHTRLRAAEALGLDTVPVRFMDLDPADARLLALADNKLGEIATWDTDTLSDVLKELEADGAVLEGLGWTGDELAELLADLDPSIDEPDEAPALDDELPEAPPAITQPGEVITIGRHTLHCGDCIEVMRAMPDNSIDAIVTDPPYGLSPDGRARTWDDIEEGRTGGGFMGKAWDAAVPGLEWATECLRVLKPGGHLVAFGGTRTIHRLTCALEDAGLEIRDCGAWVYWQGFPKSMRADLAIDRHFGREGERKVVGENIGTKPRQSVEHRESEALGSGWHAIPGPNGGMPITEPATPEAQKWKGWGTGGLKPAWEPYIIARKPMDGTLAENLLEWGTGAINIDGCRIAPGDPAWPGPGEVSADAVQRCRTEQAGHTVTLNIPGHTQPTFHPAGRWPANLFHCPKPSRSEREEGCEELAPITGADAVDRSAGSAGMESPRAGAGRTATTVRNHHPTVKPSRLFRWLVRLVTPPGGVVLEPFTGSGTTMLAAEREGFASIGIEREASYCDIARARLTAAIEAGD